MLVVFGGAPLLLWRSPQIFKGGGLFLFLTTMSLACGLALFFDKTFDRRKFWNAKAVMPAMGWVVGRWIIAAVVLTTLFGLTSGHRLPGLRIAVPTEFWRVFKFEPSATFIAWADSQATLATWLPDMLVGAYPYIFPLLIFVFYPLISVYPQNVIYRSFFCHRYRAILGGDWVLIFVSAIAFSFGHIIVNNWVVLLLTLVGGIIFTRTYLKSRSLLLASIEHAMYGLFCFYLGVGVFLIYGASG